MIAELAASRPKIFADTADPKQIGEFKNWGLLSGVTTNTTIMLQQGVKEPVEHLARIVDLFPSIPVSVQLTPGEPSQMLDTAHEYAGVSGDVVVKVIMDRPEDWKVFVALATEGVKTNVTGLMSARQATFSMMAVGKNGQPLDPTFVSLFFNRMKDAKADPLEEIRLTRALIEQIQAKTLIIAGSIRSAKDVEDAFRAGAHIVTVPPKNVPPEELVKYYISHFKTHEFAEQAIRDARA